MIAAAYPHVRLPELAPALLTVVEVKGITVLGVALIYSVSRGGKPDAQGQRLATQRGFGLMTRQKHLKQRIRTRMEKTGERYASARRQVVDESSTDSKQQHPHLPGQIPLVTALRVLLTHAGVTAEAGKPLSEAMILGLAGGIGAGVFAFYYDEFSSFYVAGRHLWYDDLGCLKNACNRLGLEVTIKEFGGAGPAEKGLASLLQDGPVIAWVDLGTLPHRGLPQRWSGGGYHLVSVYQSEPGGESLIGDLAEAPVPLSTSDLTKARGRIKKDKYRLLSVKAPKQPVALQPALTEGMAACATGLVKGRIKNFTIDSFGTWADALAGSKGKDSWEKMFPPGHRLWRGLTSIYEFIEHFGTGRGLMRPMFAGALREAGELMKRPEFTNLAADYAALGKKWSALAQSALPSHYPAFARARELISRKAEITLSGKGNAASVCAELESLGASSATAFPLTDEQAAQLRKELQSQVRIIHQEETRLAAALNKLVN